MITKFKRCMCDHCPNVYNYGGPLSNRIRFPLEVLKRVQDQVGDFPVGYRFLADEWLPDGLQVKESALLAQALAENGVAYISTMGGTYESFYLPEMEQGKAKRLSPAVSINTRHLNEKICVFNFLLHPCGFHPRILTCIR